jgi:glycerate kinase
MDIKKVPVADGGEGTVEAFITAAGGTVVDCKVAGPLRDETDSFFGILNDGKTAVIEMAAASGLELVPEDKRNPMETTTYGTGQLIIEALDRGCVNIIVGVGGSATTDGGMGAAQALGVVFYDSDGKPLSYGGKHMLQIAYYDDSALDERVKKANITVACDVTNPFYGKNGAAHIYSAQKGASNRQIRLLDKGLRNMASIIHSTRGFDVNRIAGSGAAGGLAGGLAAFAGAVIESGFDVLASTCNLEDIIKDADLVITGEGSTDYQSAFGKVPVGIARISAVFGVPVICISGSLGQRHQEVYKEGITAVFSICPGPIDLKESIQNAGHFISEAVYNAVRTWLAGRGVI